MNSSSGEQYDRATRGSGPEPDGRGLPRAPRFAVFIGLLCVFASLWVCGSRAATDRINPVATATVPGAAPTVSEPAAALSAELKLGIKLFHDDRFSSPKGDFLSSCSRCHQFDQDPQGLHAYNDLLNRSWQPFRIEDPRREAARNAPVLLDSGAMPRLHYDGEFRSLEDLVKGTLSGRTMGWLPGEHNEAFDYVRKVIVNDKTDDSGEAERYADEFQSAYGVDVTKLDRDALVDLAARAISAYVRTLKTSRTTPYDEFVRMNQMPEAPAAGESARDYAASVESKLTRLQATGELKLPKGFDREALAGMRIFFRGGSARSAGNCAVCHVPPYFTDFSFHNIGISQVDYDNIHGEGSFGRLQIPDAATGRPIEHFRRFPLASDSNLADLGYWNFADVATSGLKHEGESNQAFMRRMIGTFKTPTLRDLAYSGPYMHDGAYTSLDEALSALAELSEKAREGRVRSADAELPRIKISSSDIAPLVAFLKTLNEDLASEYRASQ